MSTEKLNSALRYPPGHPLRFREAVHIGTGVPVTEVWSADEKELIGVLYPTTNGVKFVSKYITNHPQLVVVDPVEPPAVIITLAGVSK